MRGLGRCLRRPESEGGFTVAEVLIAGLVMVVAMIPIIGMFDGALSAVRHVSDIHASIACAETATEQIKAIPFYKPYTGTNRDVDDFFWGSRTPINSNPAGGDGGPDWANIPEVAMYGYGAMPDYEAYRVGVKMAYLADDTGTCAMQQFWGPKTAGNDLPKSADSRQIHLMVFQVNVRWMVGGTETGLYSQIASLTDTQATYNLGVSRITVTAPDALKGTLPNAAAHWPNQTLSVTIDGWGFDPATIDAWLVRDKSQDIPIALATKNRDQLTGTVNISDTATVRKGQGTNQDNKAEIGYWSVKVRQKDILSVYLYQGFIVEYPKPTISNFYNTKDSTKTARDIDELFTIHADGGRFINFAESPTMRLVQMVASGDPAIITGTVTSITGSSNGYADSGCTLEATFDPAGKPAGDYKLEIIDTRPELVGHVSSGLTNSVFTITAATPAPTDVAVNSGGLHYGYNNQGNPWRLKITGSDFNMSGTPAVDVALCAAVASGVPSGNQVSGTVVSVSGNNTIVADFDLSGLPTGFYIGWVKNRNNNLAGWTPTAPFEVRNFSAAVTGFTPNPGSSFYENYYDIPSNITGSGLAMANAVKITDGTVTYDITGDSTLGGDSSIPVSLNLISCAHNNWTVQVYFPGGIYLERAFTVSLGPAKILAANNSKYAIRIHAQHGSGDQWNNETTSARAWAWRTTGIFVKTRGYATLEVKGMGFPMTGSNTTLRVWQGSVSAWKNCAASMDRAGKTVIITSDKWEMPESTGDCGISVQNTIGDTTLDSYATRWYLQ